MNNRTEKLLKERGSRYGEFGDLAKISQDLKDRWYLEQNCEFKDPTSAMNEAMEMVLHKLARIMNGDRYYLDSVDDMIGYLELYRQAIKDAEEIIEEEDLPFRDEEPDEEQMENEEYDRIADITNEILENGIIPIIITKEDGKTKVVSPVELPDNIKELLDWLLN